MDKTLHFCWLIDPWAESRAQYLQTWKDKGWSVVLWHGGQLSSSPVEGVELRDGREIITGSPIEEAYLYEARHTYHAACADLFRWEVLYQLGGSYADIDVFPKKRTTPKAFAKKSMPIFNREWWNIDWHLEIRFIVTPAARDPLIEELRDTAVDNERTFMAGGGYTNGVDGHVVHRTGPRMAEPIVYAYGRKMGVHKRELQRSTIFDCTPENVGEHHYLKFPAIAKIAGLT